MQPELSTRGLEREAMLALNKRVTAITALLVGPVVVANLAWQAWVQPVWQFWALALSMLVTDCCWVYSYLLARRGHLRSSAGLMMFAALLFDASAMFLRQETLATAALADVGMIVYGWIFSSGLAIGVAVFAVLSLGSLRVLGYLGMLPAAAPVGSLGLVLDLCILGAVIPVLMYFLHRRNRISELPYQQLSEAAERQRQLLETVARLQPQVEALVGQGEQAARMLAAQASQQAATSEQVEGSMRLFGAMLAEARQTAQLTRESAERTREQSSAGCERLAGASAQLERSQRVMDEVQAGMGHLAEQSQRTEEVIAFIRAIDEKLKVLAINAALEAARSGEVGRGFAVVAQELRSMLEESTSSLARGRALLAGIGEEAAKTLERTAAASSQLSQNLGALREARAEIEQLAGGFVGTAQRVEAIATAADQQQHEVERVSRAMAELRQSAGGLTDSARRLSEGMARLAREQHEVRELLSSVGAAKAA